MSYTGPNVSLLPNRSYATLQVGGNLSLLLESRAAADQGLPGLLNLQESHWGSREPPSRSTHPLVLYKQRPAPGGWLLADTWKAAAAEVVSTVGPFVLTGAVAGLMLGYGWINDVLECYFTYNLIGL